MNFTTSCMNTKVFFSHLLKTFFSFKQIATHTRVCNQMYILPIDSKYREIKKRDEMHSRLYANEPTKDKR